MKLGHCIRACFAVGLAYFASEPIARATDWKLTALAADGEEKWAGLWNPASREALWLKTGARRAGVVLVSCDMDLQIAEIETENGRATLPLAAGMEAPGGFTDEDISRMLDTMPPEAVGKLIGVAWAPPTRPEGFGARIDQLLRQRPDWATLATQRVEGVGSGIDAARQHHNAPTPRETSP